MNNIMTKAKNECCGCTACYNACPVGCISMKRDEEGFSYPEVDKTRCIECGKCKNVCPTNLENIKKSNVHEKILCYACINRNEQIRKKSSSGGIFSLLAQAVVANGGRVYGAGYNDSRSVIHKGIEDIESLNELYGSKYVQSDMGHIYQEIKALLEEEREVMFSGTPCQVAGLKMFLGKEYKKLYCVDVICHGVPSPLIWEEYLSFLEKKYGREIDNELYPSFRDKTKGWLRFCIYVPFQQRKQYRRYHDMDLYMKSFLKNQDLRESCYNCCFRGVSTLGSDITLGDFWGIQKMDPEMFDNKGTSLVIIRSKRGESLFTQIREGMRCKEVDTKQAFSYNSAVFKSPVRPKARDVFFCKWQSEGIENTLKEINKERMKERILKYVINVGVDIKLQMYKMKIIKKL